MPASSIMKCGMDTAAAFRQVYWVYGKLVCYSTQKFKHFGCCDTLFLYTSKNYLYLQKMPSKSFYFGRNNIIFFSYAQKCSTPDRKPPQQKFNEEHFKA